MFAYQAVTPECDTQHFTVVEHPASQHSGGRGRELQASGSPSVIELHKLRETITSKREVKVEEGKREIAGSDVYYRGRMVRVQREEVPFEVCTPNLWRTVYIISKTSMSVTLTLLLSLYLQPQPFAWVQMRACRGACGNRVYISLVQSCCLLPTDAQLEVWETPPGLTLLLLHFESSSFS